MLTVFIKQRLVPLLRSAPDFNIFWKRRDALTALHTAAHATHHTTKDRQNTPAFEACF